MCLGGSSEPCSRAARIADAGSNIAQVSVSEDDEDYAEMTFDVLVRDRVHLAQVLRSIRLVSDLKTVGRTCA